MVIHSFQELKNLVQESNPKHSVEEGDVYLINDDMTGFTSIENAKRHPYVVIAVNDQKAIVCPRTTKFQGNRNNGVHHHADPVAGLNKDGIILTKKYLRFEVAVNKLTHDTYLGTIGRNIATSFTGIRAKYSN